MRVDKKFVVRLCQHAGMETEGRTVADLCGALYLEVGALKHARAAITQLKDMAADDAVKHEETKTALENARAEIDQLAEVIKTKIGEGIALRQQIEEQRREINALKMTIAKKNQALAEIYEAPAVGGTSDTVDDAGMPTGGFRNLLAEVYEIFPNVDRMLLANCGFKVGTKGSIVISFPSTPRVRAFTRVAVNPAWYVNSSAGSVVLRKKNKR